MDRIWFLSPLFAPSTSHVLWIALENEGWIEFERAGSTNVARRKELFPASVYTQNKKGKQKRNVKKKKIHIYTQKDFCLYKCV